MTLSATEPPAAAATAAPAASSAVEAADPVALADPPALAAYIDPADPPDATDPADPPDPDAPPLRAPFLVGDHSVDAGTRRNLSLPVARSPIQAFLEMPVMVAHGLRPGPRVFLSAAVHGDELNGLEIIWRVMEALRPKRLRGTVVAVPIVNVFGFSAQSRYLPDRRDLNRSFPGTARGSLAARVAYQFQTEIMAGCDVGIDLHTGSLMRSNYPQVRANLEDPETYALAEVFGAPVMMHAAERKGSLRRAAVAAGIRCLLYEGGEGQRFDHRAIEIGVAGIHRVLGYLGAVPVPSGPTPTTRRLGRSSWVRATRGGLVHLEVAPGDVVDARADVGRIVDVYGKRVARLKAPFDGVVLARANNPLVHKGDAVIHVGRLDLDGGEDDEEP